ncbi:TetR/AcrR family transcriptional regulator [Saccharopolyspora mangrovi]|uniref:TetR/AcrR family transcriptional regulator n=1 Tax=Saccharopolyspora mangrovi TaxID=3082379 RepID=A0ABU6A9M8_9PSEU|nr:TetR/AcrR family transcriptional regulator [Saccharopolyspora sp. S2-29]MEB3368241.1 TetR/AcrR family transcriptional regulator [Saccharopolyspora sp. S2-29]
MTSSPAIGGRKRMSRAEREAQILEVAERVFANDGYQTSSMDDIAGQVGLSKPMLYEYFGSKEGLLLACLRRSKSELLEATSHAAAHAASTEQLLYDCLLAFFRFGDEHQQAWALLRNEFSIPNATVNTELEAIRIQQRDFTADLLRKVREDLDDEQAEAYAESIIGASERLALWREHRPEVTAEKATEHMIALFAPGLGF